MVNSFPTMRLRRLRSSQVMRDLLQEHTVSLNDLIYPIFVEEDLEDFAPVDSMPGIFRIPERKLDAAVKENPGGDDVRREPSEGRYRQRFLEPGRADGEDDLAGEGCGAGADADLRLVFLRVYVAWALRGDPRRGCAQRPHD